MNFNNLSGFVPYKKQNFAIFQCPIVRIIGFIPLPEKCMLLCMLGAGAERPRLGRLWG
jgi:hypothetical protein